MHLLLPIFAANYACLMPKIGYCRGNTRKKALYKQRRPASERARGWPFSRIFQPVRLYMPKPFILALPLLSLAACASPDSLSDYYFTEHASMGPLMAIYGAPTPVEVAPSYYNEGFAAANF